MSAFTVDVEDWYQSCVDYDAPITERVVRNVDRILAMLDRRGVKGTFFVQGLVAEAFPAMVAELVRCGHEVQSHGYSHRPLNGMARTELKDEIERAKKTVEDASGTRVTAFRAQDFSILPGNLWALEVLAEVGFRTDSSIFPVRTPRYGVPGWPLEPRRLELPAGAILEVPVAIWRAGRARVPVAGGGYFRLIPQRLLMRALNGIVADGRPAVLYCHPYEFSPGEVEDYRSEVPAKVRVSQGIGRRAMVERLEALLGSLPFGRFDAVLASWGLA